MNKKAQYIVIASGLVIGGVYLITKWLHNLPKPKNPVFENDTTTKAPIKLADKDKVLSKGSKGLEVGLLQNKMGGVVIDGIFGDKTEKRLMDLKGVSKISLNEFDKK